MVPVKQFLLGGQRAWYHDEGHAAGYFHTYDEFRHPGSLFHSRKLTVFLPRCYEDGRQHHPVIYVNDGDTAFFPGGVKYQTLDIANTLARSFGRHPTRQPIVVAVHPIDRNREYTHVPWYGPSCCELCQYADYLAGPLKSFVDRWYRTCPEPEQTMVLGWSHGGLAAFYTACHRPDAFRMAAAMSPSFWVGLDDSESFPQVLPRPHRTLRDSDLVQTAASTLAAPLCRPRIYLDWGLVRTGGSHNEQVEERAATRGAEMAALLKEQFGYRVGYDLVVREDPNGDHTELSWARRIDGIMNIFDAWRGDLLCN